LKNIFMFFNTIPPIRPPGISGIPDNPDKAPEMLGKFIGSAVGILLIGSTLWAFAQLLLGGVQWITSGGDKAQVETAQHRITNAIIGLLIVAVSWAAYLIILQMLGITEGPGFNIQLPTLLGS
jgi:hypothetical protein